MKIIGVSGDAGFERGNREFIRLRRGKSQSLYKKIMAQLFGKVSGDLRCHTVGNDIENAGKSGTEDH